MSNDRRNPKPISDSALIDADTISTVLRKHCNNTDKQPFEILQTEPVLSEFLHAELLKTFGKLALAGANPAVVRGISADLHRLLGITAGAFQTAYRDLLEDLMPEAEFDPRADEPGENPSAPLGDADSDNSDPLF